MKIGIDIYELNNQEIIIIELIKNIKIINKDDKIIIYSSVNFFSNKENIKIIKVNNDNFFKNQIFFLKQLNKDKNDFFISFSELRPIFYNKNTFQIVTSLEKILYPNIENTRFLKKYSLNLIRKINFKNAKKIICYNKKTKKEINEKLNIKDEKIEIIIPFFLKKLFPTSKINIKNKHSINGEYLIYDAGIGSNKNIKKILESLEEINKEQNLSLIIIGDDISNDIELRSFIINMKIKEKIIFVGTPDKQEIGLYYQNALGVIMASLYENFPGNLSSAIQFKTNIISSELDEIKDIFQNKINYFSPISTSDIVSKIKDLIINGKKEINYDDIIENYSIEKFINKLIELIK